MHDDPLHNSGLGVMEMRWKSACCLGGDTLGIGRMEADAYNVNVNLM